MEIWKPIDGWPYEVSSLGNVRREGKSINLKLTLGNHGYLYCNLSKDGSVKPMLLHRLIASLFIENPERLPFVDHINRNRTDNRIENLRWVSRETNRHNTTVLIKNKLGQKHISFDRLKNKYKVQITHNKLFALQKYYKTLEEAIVARDTKLAELGRIL